MIIRPVISVPLPWLTILVGRFYPGGDREKKKKASFFPRTLKVTKLGKWYIAILLLIGIAAINTGNNLLYLVVGMLLSLIIISGIMSESTLRGIEVKRLLPRRIFAGTPVTARLDIDNNKRVLPSFSFSLIELPAPSVSATEAYVLKLTHNEAATRHNTYTFKRRGEVELRGILIRTSFPFSLFTKGKREITGARRLIYPSIRPIKEIAELRSFDSSSDNTKELKKKGDGSELHSLKEYSPGDDSRRIDWKSSARAQKLMTKEFEEEPVERFMIDFDNANASGTEELFEQMVSDAASLACHLTGRGFYVGLKTRDNTINCARGRAHLFTMLETLALIEPSEMADASSGAASVKVRPV